MPNTQLDTAALDQGTYVVVVSYFDEDGAAETPNSASWSLADTEGNIVNSRSSISIVTPGTSNNIVLSALDLAITGAGLREKRLLTVEWLYDSTYGSGLPGKAVAEFWIEANPLIKTTTTLVAIGEGTFDVQHAHSLDAVVLTT